MDTCCDIVIVGGGAAGLTAAISAAAAMQNKTRTQESAALHVSAYSAPVASCEGMRQRVVVLEAADRVGRSILATGNGRCNFSHASIAEGFTLVEYRNAEFVRDTYAALNKVFFEPDFNDPVLDFFENIGLEWRQEEDGRRYPLANKASVVLDVLRAEAARLGVEEVCGCKVVQVTAPREVGKSFTIQTETGEFWRARAVVLAIGGAATDKLRLESIPGHDTFQEVGRRVSTCEQEGRDCTGRIPLTPVLGPLRVKEVDQSFTRALDNIRVRCCVSLFREGLHLRTETGELLFRPYGVSGICVYNLSRLAHAGDYLHINFLQIDEFDRARDYIGARYRQLVEHFGQAPTYAQFMRGAVLPRVAEAICKQAKIKPEVVVEGEAGLENLFQILCMCTLEIAGIGPAEQCQVHRGGFAVEGINAHTMQVEALPSLYVCGEALDVDGPCGGYNLHWAWASGLLAGHSAAQFCLQDIPPATNVSS